MTTTATYELVELDPSTLKVSAANLRKKRPDIADLVSSIKEVGILQPLVVTRDGEIVAGYRRSLAGMKLKLATVPCMRFLGEGDAETLRAMLAENTARQDLTDVEEADGYRQLALLNVSVEQIARSTGRKVDTVRAASAAAAAPVSMEFAGKYDLTLEQLIVLAEFEEAPEAQKTVAECFADGGDVDDWEVRGARRRIELERRHNEEVAKWAAKGVTAVTAIAVDNNTKPLVNLTDADGNAFTEAKHRKCPGHVVHLMSAGGAPGAAVPWCTDWRNQGHLLAGHAAGEVEETEADRRAQESVLKAAETRAKNKVWRQAAARRRTFLVGLGERELSATEALAVYRFLGRIVVSYPSELTITAKAQRAYAAELFDVPPEKLQPYGHNDDVLGAIVRGATDQDFPLELLKLMAAAFEPELSWQNQYAVDRHTVPWLGVLSELGYEPAEMEMEIIQTWCEANAPITGPACRVCGCTDEEACDDGCAWMGNPDEEGRDICSACAEKAEQAAELPSGTETEKEVSD